ncbi:MAG TPA: DinB family protein [Dehalococcoidia bacterium]|nr:DinB family protein [Dehalococcoidia bacterium]
MVSKQDVSESLMLNVQRAEKMAAGLTDADLAKPVYSAEGPEWTVKDIFAHLASMGASPAFFIGMAQRAMSSSGGGGGMPAGFDVDAFNNQQVEIRKEKAIFDLLAEFRKGHEQGVELIASTPDEVLTKKMPNPFEGGMSSALEMIGGSCGDHEAQHMMDIAQALRG